MGTERRQTLLYKGEKGSEGDPSSKDDKFVFVNKY